MTVPADDRLRSLCRGLPEPLLVLAGGGQVVISNPAAEEQLQRGPAELHGRTLTDLAVDAPEGVADYLRLCGRAAEPMPGAFSAWVGVRLVRFRCEGRAIVGPESPALLVLHFWRKDAPGRDTIGLLGEVIEALGHEILRRRALEAQLAEARAELAETRGAAPLGAGGPRPLPGVVSTT